MSEPLPDNVITTLYGAFCAIDGEFGIGGRGVDNFERWLSLELQDTTTTVPLESLHKAYELALKGGNRGNCHECKRRIGNDERAGHNLRRDLLYCLECAQLLGEPQPQSRTQL